MSYDVEALDEAYSKAAFGEPVRILEDLYLVRVPLPNNPLHVINSYFILEDDGTTTIIDVGFNHPDCDAALRKALASLGRSPEKVQVVLTHSHPDHTGNLDRIWRPGMKVYAYLHSFQEVKNLMKLEEAIYGPLLLQAASAEQESEITYDGEGRPRFHLTAELLPLESYPLFTYVSEGDVLAFGPYTFEVIETPGHDAWHICLYERSRRLMIVGDHVLERITPAVYSWFPARDALQDFLDSLRKVAGYEVDLILPAHGRPFTGLQERVEFLLGHHEARLEEMYELVRAGHDDIMSISQNATWRYPDWASWPMDQKYFSMGETLAHLIHLVRQGRILQGVCGWEYYFRMPYDRKNVALAKPSDS